MTVVTRVLCVLVLGLSVAATLTACAPSRGETAAEWLREQPVVVAVDTSGYSDGLAPESDIYADLDPAANAQAVRELAGATSDFVAESGFLGAVVIHFRVDRFVLTPGSDRVGAEASADLLATAREDARVHRGQLAGSESVLVTSRTDLIPVFTDLVGAASRLLVQTEDATWSVAGGDCGALSPAVAALFSEPAATSLTAEACAESILGVATPAEVVPIALAIAGTDGTGTAVRVASEPVLGGTPAGQWSVDTGMVTPQTLPLLTAAVDLDPQTLVLDPLGLALGLSSTTVRDGMHALLGPEAPEDVDPLVFDYGSVQFLVGDRIVIAAHELTVALSRLDLAEQVTALDDAVRVSASFGVVDIHIDGVVDETLGRALLEEIAPRAARDVANVVITDDAGNSFSVDEDEPPSAEGDRGELLLGIFESLD